MYTFLRHYVDWAISGSYRKTEIHGEENIPQDGALIFAPNHCNTLMDALVMLNAYNGSTVFGARADIFNNKFIADIMYFLRILPMVRQRDGLRNVLKNKDTQETIVETLEHNVRFCMFPKESIEQCIRSRFLAKACSEQLLLPTPNSEHRNLSI